MTPELYALIGKIALYLLCVGAGFGLIVWLLRHQEGMSAKGASSADEVKDREQEVSLLRRQQEGERQAASESPARRILAERKRLRDRARSNAKR